jgi:hypothetical protein
MLALARKKSPTQRKIRHLIRILPLSPTNPQQESRQGIEGYQLTASTMPWFRG